MTPNDIEHHKLKGTNSYNKCATSVTETPISVRVPLRPAVLNTGNFETKALNDPKMTWTLRGQR